MEELKKTQSPWALDPRDIFIPLKTKEEGLNEKEAQARLIKFGKNAFGKREKKSAIGIFLKQLASPLIFVLIAAAVITAVLQEWVEVAVISIAVLVNSGLGFFREYHAENTLAKLSTFIKDRTRVIRNGHEEEIDSEDIVLGDIIKLSYGSRIPADARIIHTSNLKVDEAILTGESVAVQKSADTMAVTAAVAERKNMAHAGTMVVDGFATAVVVATGDKTEIGRIAGLVSGTERAETPIQKGLSKLAWVIFCIVVVIVIGIFILGISRGESVLEMLILSVAVSVGAVPEALPIALTVILSIGSERIAKRKAVARTLMAAETLGSTSLIMTDKTGTLTEANMRLVGIYDIKELTSGNTEERINKDDNEILEIASANIDIIIENPDEEFGKWTFKGKPFEVNIARTARDNGIDLSHFKTAGASSIVIPFNSTHKFSVANYKGQQTVMGAPDILLARSDTDPKNAKKIEEWIISASNGGQRLIALGKLRSNAASIRDVKDFEFVGILAFRDPIRKEVPAAIKKIESLGIKVVMVTGDLKGTAMSVAKELGWEVNESEVLTGNDLQMLSDEQLSFVLPKIKIFTRVTPEDKLRIGTLYRKLGEVVAMTGDGVNDAPSLKAMDIGVAIGSGSDVAKSAADLVLLDDNFQTISMAIQEGRRILVNIRKTFVYLMSNSLDEVFVIGGSLIVGIALPLSAIQIIWVNLFTGSLPALAFAYDENFDNTKSKKHTLKSIFTKEVNFLTFGIGIASSVLLFVVYYGLLKFGIDVPLARSVFFVCFASYILVIAYSFRSLHKPLFSYPTFSNKKLNQSILLAVLILIGTMVINPVREMFGLAEFPPVWLLFVLVWLVLNVLLVEGAKYLFRKIKWHRKTNAI